MDNNDTAFRNYLFYPNQHSREMYIYICYIDGPKCKKKYSHMYMRLTLIPDCRRIEERAECEIYVFKTMAVTVRQLHKVQCRMMYQHVHVLLL